MNVKSSAFHFQSVSETNGNWKMLRNGGGFGGWSLISSTMLKNCIALVQRILQNQKLILPQYRKTQCPPPIEHPIEEVESKWNTSELYLKSSFGRLHPINFEFLFRNSRTLSSVVILGAVQTWIFSLSNAVSFTGLITYFSFSPTLLAEYAYVLAEGVSHFCKHFFRMLSCYWEKPM